jgi:alpha-methylacyl-CoA racemase
MTEVWKPLRGIKVVDLTRMLPGGTATLLLADLGAEVTKVEPPGGDDTRYLEPRVGEDSSVQHQYMDRGKSSIMVDLKDPAGRQQVLDLCASADAVIESYRPGVADRLGVGYAAVAAIRPEIVYVSLSGYGQTGPMATSAGHDLNFVGMAGLVSSTPIVQMADVPAGMLAALGIVSGVLAARQSGRGEHLDLALADAALVFGGSPLAEALGGKTLGTVPVTPLDGVTACYQIYRCADDLKLAVGAIEPKFWRQVVDQIGRPEWFDRQADRSLTPEMAALFATRPRAEWMELLGGPDTCVTVVGDLTDLVDDPYVVARGALVQHDSPAGPLWQVAPPLRRITPGA